jgi:hypothetical protein
MKRVSKYPWSFLSIAITVVTVILTLGASRLLSGVWRPKVGSGLSFVAGAAAVVSLVLAVVALVKERPKSYALLALVLNILSFFL